MPNFTASRELITDPASDPEFGFLKQPTCDPGIFPEGGHFWYTCAVHDPWNDKIGPFLTAEAVEAGALEHIRRRAQRPRGLVLGVYRRADGDASLNGLSARHQKVTVVGIIDKRHAPEGAHVDPQPLPEDFRHHEASAQAPAVYLVVWQPCGFPAAHLIPASNNPYPAAFFSAGGNYAGTSNGLWVRLVDRYPGAERMIPIHDRAEHLNSKGR